VKRAVPYLMSLNATLFGLLCFAGASTLQPVGGGLLGAAPFALFGAGALAAAVLVLPRRWTGRPEEKEIEIGGVPATALVFPFAHGRFAASAVAFTLWTLATLAGIAAGWRADEPWTAALFAVLALAAAPMAVASIRRLVRGKHLAMTPDLLSLRAPANRVTAPWEDVESIDLLPVGGRLFYAITLMPGVDAPTGRWVWRLARTYGAHLFFQADWLTAPSDEVMEAFERHHATPSPDTGVIG
jgi:hypothetical protein